MSKLIDFALNELNGKEKKEEVFNPFKIDWFAFTVFADIDELDIVWDMFFRDALGVRVPREHGLRGYERTDMALEGAMIYYKPKVGENEGVPPKHWHIELKGKSLACLTPSTLSDLVKYLELNYVHKSFDSLTNDDIQEDFSRLLLDVGGDFGKARTFIEKQYREQGWHVTRLDFAFDDDMFSPEQFFEIAKTSSMVTLAKRESIMWFEQPFQLDEKGHLGTSGMSLGSRQSERMLRVYNLHGFTRVELQMRGERAQRVACDVLTRPFVDWIPAAKSHLLQYVTFKDWDDWELFSNLVIRASMKISSARIVSLDRMKKWFERQVAVPMSVMFEVEPDTAYFWWQDVMQVARDKRNRERYSSLLQVAEKQVDIVPTPPLDPPDFVYDQQSF